MEEDDAGRGMQSVVVVHKHGDSPPGPGFFGLNRAMSWLREQGAARCRPRQAAATEADVIVFCGRSWSSAQPNRKAASTPVRFRVEVIELEEVGGDGETELS